MKKVKVEVPHLQKIAISAYRPGIKRLQILLSILAAVAIAWTFYEVGAAGIHMPWSNKHEKSPAQLRLDLKAATQEINSLRKQVARLTRSTQVESQTTEKVKHALHEKDLEILKLTEELVFYRSLLAPEKAGAGVELRDFNLRAGADQSEYYYDFLLTQSSRSKQLAEGNINVAIDGKQAGVMRRIALLHEGGTAAAPLVYSFKYFQRLNGVFVLPDNFEPQKISIELMPAADSKQALHLSYSWNELISGG